MAANLTGRGLIKPICLLTFSPNSPAAHRSHTTMVGDRRHDAMGAIANGVRAVGVLSGIWRPGGTVGTRCQHAA